MKLGLFDDGAPIEGMFDIIVADPPWRSDFGRTNSRSAERHYPTMPLQDIEALQLPAAPDALLFLWSPPSMLTQALRVMRAWGFSYRTSGIWCKTTRSSEPRPIMGGGSGSGPATSSSCWAGGAPSALPEPEGPWCHAGSSTRLVVTTRRSPRASRT